MSATRIPLFRSSAWFPVDRHDRSDRCDHLEKKKFSDRNDHSDHYGHGNHFPAIVVIAATTIAEIEKVLAGVRDVSTGFKKDQERFF